MKSAMKKIMQTKLAKTKTWEQLVFFFIDNPNGSFLATDLDRTYGPSTASPLGDLPKSGSGVRGPVRGPEWERAK